MATSTVICANVVLWLLQLNEYPSRSYCQINNAGRDTHDLLQKRLARTGKALGIAALSICVLPSSWIEESPCL